MFARELRVALIIDTVDDVTRQLDVVIREFADLGIVDAHNFVFFRRAEGEAGNEVDGEEDDARADEGVGEARDGVSKLVGNLDPVAVEPATGDLGETVEMRNVVGSEESSEQVADQTANSVHGEDIESVIDFEKVLELGSVVAADTADNTEDNSRPGGNETGTRRDGNETGDDAGAEADSGPLAFETVVEETPGHATNGGSQVGNDGGHDGAKVGAERGSGVETEPAHPEEDGADDDVSNVVRAVVEFVSAVATTLAEHERVGESSSA